MYKKYIKFMNIARNHSNRAVQCSLVAFLPRSRNVGRFMQKGGTIAHIQRIINFYAPLDTNNLLAALSLKEVPSFSFPLDSLATLSRAMYYAHLTRRESNSIILRPDLSKKGVVAI